MKKIRVLNGLLFTILGGVLSFSLIHFSGSDIVETKAYSAKKISSVTTIDLNDCSDSEIKSYYSSLTSKTTSEKKGNNLLKNLKTILKTNQQYFSYDKDSLWNLYEISDRDWEKSPVSTSATNYDYNPTTKIITNYQYNTVDPYVHSLYTKRSVDNQAKAHEDHTQIDWGINQEHIWPKSQGFDKSGDGGARGDPMHLQAGNGAVNNMHSNYMYGYVDLSMSYTKKTQNYLDTNYLGTSLTTHDSGTYNKVFEPQDSDKGDIARAIFYMVARYNYISGSDPDGINQNNPNLELRQSTLTLSSYTTTETSNPGYQGLMTDLLNWNRIDPPDEYEIHRNNILYRNYTNNRNPFIDYPEWAEYIWGKAEYSGREYQSYDSTPTGNINLTTDVINGFKGNTPTVQSLELSGTYQTTFTVGDTFNHTGMVVTAVKTDSTREEVTSSATWSTPNMTTAGNKTITVSYGGRSITYSITVNAPTLNKIELSGTYQTSFFVNDTFNHNGLVVEAVYSNGDRVDVSDEASVSSPNMSTAGNKTVTVRYGGKNKTYTITVSNPTLESIDISGTYKTRFNIGETFNHSGMVVEANYSDGSSVDVTSSASWSSPDMMTEGTKTVYVTYLTEQTSYQISVGDGSNGYYRVESEPTSWAGEYLLVYDDLSYAWTGVDAGQCHTDVTIDNNYIAEKPSSAVTLSIAPMTGGYSIRVNGGTNDGKYVGSTSGRTNITFSDVEALNVISYNSESSCVDIVGQNNYKLRYNKTTGSSNERFRYYNNTQQLVQLYKYINVDLESAETYANKLYTSIVCYSGSKTPTISGTTWLALSSEYSSLTSNAKNYLIDATYTVSGSTVTPTGTTTQTIADGIARYDQLVSKYSSTYSNFMNRVISSSVNYLVNNNDNKLITIALLAVSISSVTLLGVCIFIKRRKQEF